MDTRLTKMGLKRPNFTPMTVARRRSVKLADIDREHIQGVLRPPAGAFAEPAGRPTDSD